MPLFDVFFRDKIADKTCNAIAAVQFFDILKRKPGFLETVGAEIALISVGKDNPYGHPDFDILNRLRNVGSAVYRTDECGWIAVFMDDGGVNIRYGRE